MKKYKTISIIIPVYNEENYIVKIIEKVAKANSLSLKKEVIVINDGSTDKSELKIKNIELSLKKDKKILSPSACTLQKMEKQLQLQKKQMKEVKQTSQNY